MDEKLKEYISQARLRGQSSEEIRQQLLTSGWPVNLVNEAFGQSNTPKAMPSAEGPVSYSFNTSSSFSSNTETIQHKETIAIKIVALWLFLVGLFGFLIAIGAGIGGFMALSNTRNWDSFYPIANIIFMIGEAVGIGFMAVMAFKIRSGLHKLEHYAYQSASIFFITIAIGSLVTALITLVLTKQSGEMVSGVVSVLVNGVLLLLLHSQQHLFTSENVTSALKTKTIIALVIMFLFLPIGLYTQVAASY